MSEESFISIISETENNKTKEEEEEETEAFQVPINIDNNLGYQYDIKKFHSVLKKQKVDIKSSWDNLNIKETSPDQLEMNIQRDRIMLIIKRLTEKLKVVGFLSTLLENDGEVLKKYMKLENAQYILDKYSSLLGDSSIISSKKSLSKSKSSSDTDLSFHKLMKLILENDCLVKYINKQKFRDLDEFVQEIIRALHKFSEVLDRQLNLSSEEEREKTERFKLLYLEFCERTANIKRLEETLNQQTKETNEKLCAKETIINQYKSKIGVVRENFNLQIIDAVKASEKTMMIEGERAELRHDELAEESKNAQNKYTAILEDHLQIEKALRSRRFKIEAQLANWVAKYDNDIGERHNELEQIIEEYEAERVELNELECLFIEQEKIYNKYKKEKDAEDEAIFQEKLYRIIANRSARVIQRAWRSYRARKLARKKAKKDRAKNKAAKPGTKAGAKESKKKK